MKQTYLRMRLCGMKTKRTLEDKRIVANVAELRCTYDDAKYRDAVRTAYSFWVALAVDGTNADEDRKWCSEGSEGHG